MIRSKKKLQLLPYLCIALCWWGLLSPELSLTQDNVKIVYSEENSDDEEPGSDVYQENLYLQLLKAGGSKIHFRSKLLTEWNAFWEAHSWEKLIKN